MCGSQKTAALVATQYTLFKFEILSSYSLLFKWVGKRKEMRTDLLCCIAGNMPGKIHNDFKMTASIVEFIQS